MFCSFTNNEAVCLCVVLCNLLVESSQELLVVASLYTNLGIILSKMGLLDEVRDYFVHTFCMFALILTV